MYLGKFGKNPLAPDIPEELIMTAKSAPQSLMIKSTLSFGYSTESGE
ncbi:MAG: hypothetical protein II163_08845 [Ruminococcus sp.]|nr:hypothetical protein [Ruminococcus sp.]